MLKTTLSIETIGLLQCRITAVIIWVSSENIRIVKKSLYVLMVRGSSSSAYYAYGMVFSTFSYDVIIL